MRFFEEDEELEELCENLERERQAQEKTPKPQAKVVPSGPVDGNTHPEKKALYKWLDDRCFSFWCRSILEPTGEQFTCGDFWRTVITVLEFCGRTYVLDEIEHVLNGDYYFELYAPISVHNEGEFTRVPKATAFLAEEIAKHDKYYREKYGHERVGRPPSHVFEERLFQKGKQPAHENPE